MLQRNQANLILNLRLLPVSHSGCLLLFDVDFSICEIYKQRVQGILWSTVLHIACQPEPFPANQSCYFTNGYFLRYLITLSPTLHFRNDSIQRQIQAAVSGSSRTTYISYCLH
jgi:hypothetical protein